MPTAKLRRMLEARVVFMAFVAVGRMCDLLYGWSVSCTAFACRLPSRRVLASPIQLSFDTVSCTNAARCHTAGGSGPAANGHSTQAHHVHAGAAMQPCRALRPLSRQPAPAACALLPLLPSLVTSPPARVTAQRHRYTDRDADTRNLIHTVIWPHTHTRTTTHARITPHSAPPLL